MSKQQLNLYRIYSASVDIVAKNNDKKEELGTNENRIDYILSLIDGRRRPDQLVITGEAAASFSPYKVRLYFCKIPTEFQWHDFFEASLEQNNSQNESFFKTKTSLHASILCFVFGDEDIFAFTGGLGSSYIKDFVDDEFGIDALQKIANPETLEVRMARNKSVIGNVASRQNVYRGIQRTADEDKMGKVYNEIVGGLPYEDSLKKIKNLVFGDDENRPVNIRAKASLTFAKAISFLDLKQIIGFLEGLPEKSEFQFSQMKLLSKRREIDKILIENLDNDLNDLIIDTFSKLLENPDYEHNKLLEVADWHGYIYDADSVLVKRPGKGSVIELNSPYGISVLELMGQIVSADRDYLQSQLEKINGLRKEVEKTEEKRVLAQKYALCCSEDGAEIISERILSFICGELTRDDRPYFRIGEKWYKSEENCIDFINKEFLDVFSTVKFDFPINKKWKATHNENSYLEEIANSNPRQTYVFHKVISTDLQLELCDILSWDRDNIYLIHIKPSFDGAMRVLEKQITHSAKYISEDLRGDWKYLKSYFNKAKNYRGTSNYLKTIAQNIKDENEETFLDRFKEKTINFVACIVDKSNRKLENIDEFDSIVAKMSIVEAYRSIRQNAAHNSVFRISQIECDLAEE